MWVAPTFENGCIELCVSLCFLLCLHFCIHFFVCYCSSIAVFMHFQRASLQLSSVPFDKNRQKTNHQTDINKPIWPSIMWGKKRKNKQITQFDGESPSWPPLPRLLIFIEMNQQTNVNKNRQTNNQIWRRIPQLTPLFLACWAKKPEAALILLEEGADPNILALQVCWSWWWWGGGGGKFTRITLTMTETVLILLERGRSYVEYSNFWMKGTNVNCLAFPDQW